jgi:hypothetical protein
MFPLAQKLPLFKSDDRFFGQNLSLSAKKSSLIFQLAHLRHQGVGI